MKKVLLLSALALITAFYSCEDDDDGGMDFTGEEIAINDTDMIGQWEVTLFIDDGDNDTDDLDDYRLEFQEDGDLVITWTNNNESVTGSWNLSSNGRVLSIDLPDDVNTIDPDDELADLEEDDWVFIRQEGTELWLLEEDDDVNDDDRDELRLRRT